MIDGGEVRIVKISYGHHHPHGRAPELVYRAYDRLPTFVRGIIPPPPEGHGGQGTLNEKSISVWWVWIDPATHKPEICPVGRAVMTVDSGVQVQLSWPYASDEYRQILVVNPPRDSKQLHFSVPVNELSPDVHFTINNPAYDK